MEIFSTWNTNAGATGAGLSTLGWPIGNLISKINPTALTMIEYKDIKAGETYNMRVKVMAVNAECKEAGFATIPIDANGKVIENQRVYYGLCIASALLPITPQNGTKNTEPSPKYDPCREFRIGDVVRVRKIHGNLPQCRYNGMVKVKEGDCCTIHDKEHRNCYWITTPSGDNWCFDIAYFELVSPVEEQGPYRVGAGIDSQLLYCNNELFAEFEKTEDAKRVCDLLNAEYRKEVEK